MPEVYHPPGAGFHPVLKSGPRQAPLGRKTPIALMWQPIDPIWRHSVNRQRPHAVRNGGILTTSPLPRTKWSDPFWPLLSRKELSKRRRTIWSALRRARHHFVVWVADRRPIRRTKPHPDLRSPRRARRRPAPTGARPASHASPACVRANKAPRESPACVARSDPPPVSPSPTRW